MKKQSPLDEAIEVLAVLDTYASWNVRSMPPCLNRPGQPTQQVQEKQVTGTPTSTLSTPSMATFSWYIAKAFCSLL